jgi:hypothetical protein
MGWQVLPNGLRRVEEPLLWCGKVVRNNGK